MHRLFVALRPPATIRGRLLDLMHGVDGARWQDDGQLHLTLRFIGEVDRHMAEDVALALARVSAPPVELALDGIGTFDRRGRVDALWAGVSPHDALTALHARIDRACISAGLAPEGRAYLPHITLARLNRSAGTLDDFLARNAGLASPPFTLPEFGLYESTLGHGGAVYHLAERYPLSN
ncbi:MAG: RNA 2',3'-cyclic phosphodiesterase [Sphingobium sp.]|jgi:2'-5' RNA ligase|nr:MAG: RNA 2',3'-cyclic phosphodiesterase [Sphingobium sp.]